MRISDILSSNIPSQINTLLKTNPLKSGLSEVPSSLNMRQNVNEGGLFECLQQFFEKIFHFFSAFFLGTNAASSITRDPIVEKVAWGKNAIDRHFASDMIRNANGPHTLALFIFECDKQNNLYVTHSYQPPLNVHIQNLFLDEIGFKIDEWMRIPNNDGELSVTTMVFTKNHDNTYGHELWEDTCNLGTDRKRFINASAGSVDLGTIVRLLNEHVPSPEIGALAHRLQNL